MQSSDPVGYSNAMADMISARVLERQKVENEQFRTGMLIDSVLGKAKGLGINGTEFSNFCRYYDMPVSDRSLELYQDKLASLKGVNNRVGVVNEVSRKDANGASRTGITQGGSHVVPDGSAGDSGFSIFGEMLDIDKVS
jgi:hypothetical protein